MLVVEGSAGIEGVRVVRSALMVFAKPPSKFHRAATPECQNSKSTTSKSMADMSRRALVTCVRCSARG